MNPSCHNVAAEHNGKSGACARLARWRAGWAICLALLAGGAQAQRGPDSQIDLRISDGRMSLKADNVSVGEVLKRVAQALNALLSISDEQAAQIGRWDLREIPVAEAVTQIASPLNSVIVWDRDAAGSGNYLVREIYVLGGPAADLTQTAQASPPRAERIRELTRMLTSEADPGVRRSAAAELGSIGTDESVGALGRALGDADRRVRMEVLESLGRIGTNEAIRLVGQIVFGSKDPEVLAVAMRVLESSPTDLARVMLPAIKSRAPAAPSAPPESPEPSPWQ